MTEHRYTPEDLKAFEEATDPQALGELMAKLEARRRLGLVSKETAEARQACGCESCKAF